MDLYLSAAEYRAAPTAVDSNNLVAGGNQAVQDAALLEQIRRASSWINNELNQSVIAASRVELHRARYQRDGTLSIRTNGTPANQLLGLSLGTHAGDLAVVSDLSGAFIDEGQWVIPNTGVNAGGYPIQFGPRVTAGGRLLAKLTVVSGWPNTTLTASAIAGATTITVASGAGFTPALGSDVASDSVQIIDGALTETVTVSSVAGNVLTVSALVNAHSSGAVVSSMPGAIKEAATLVTSAFIRTRGSEAIIMAQGTTPGPSAGDMANRGPSLGAAARMLVTYRRVR